MHRCPLGDLMYEAKYIIVFNFSGEKSLWKIAGGLMPGSQRHEDNHNQSTSRRVQWFGLQETSIWAVTAPRCHPPLPFRVLLSRVPCTTVNPEMRIALRAGTPEKAEKGA